MARRQSTSWIELRVGFLVVVSFALLAAAIFFVGGEINLFTPTYTITAYFQSANGMNTGAEVWLEGVTVGNVDDVRVTGLPDLEQSVAVQMRIDQRFQELIQSNSVVTIGTIGLLGDKIVEITRGEQGGSTISDEGTIQGQAGGDIREIITGTNDVIANLEVLSDEVQEITLRLVRGEGTLGRMLTDTAIFDNVNATVQEANRLVRDARTGDGTISRFIYDDALYTSAVAVVERMEALVDEVENGEGTLAKLINDSTIYDEASNLVSQASSLVDRIERGEGTLGRLSRDDTLYTEVTNAMGEISTMVSNVADSEGTLGRLINDPSLHDNLNQTISEMLKLVYDFRQDPRRFLTINFRLF